MSCLQTIYFVFSDSANNTPDPLQKISGPSLKIYIYRPRATCLAYFKITPWITQSYSITVYRSLYINRT